MAFVLRLICTSSGAKEVLNKATRSCVEATQRSNSSNSSNSSNNNNLIAQVQAWAFAARFTASFSTYALLQIGVV